jgi:hypothetical protein
MNSNIQPGIIAAVAKAAEGIFTTSKLHNAFKAAGFTSDVTTEEPISEFTRTFNFKFKSKLDVANWYLGILEISAEKWTLLEAIIKLIMEERSQGGSADQERWKGIRDNLNETLTKNGCEYVNGALRCDQILPAISFEEAIRKRDMRTAKKEFERASENIITDPAAAITAACALLESVFKTILQDDGIPLPSKQSVTPLWNEVRDHLNLAPEKIPNDDLSRIGGGLASIVHGIGAFRTHKGSVHGHNPDAFEPDSRHARLVVHAAQTLALFVIETWEAYKQSKGKGEASNLSTGCGAGHDNSDGICF